MTDFRESLQAALAGADPSTSPVFTALAHALAWSVQTIDAAAATTDDAFECIIALDEALAVAPAFGQALAGLLAAGRPGDLVATDLRRGAETLDQLSQQLTVRRRQLAELAAMETALRTAAAEVADVQHQVDELRRLEGLAGSLDQVRSARRELERRGGATVVRAAAEEESLAAAVQRVKEAIQACSEDLSSEVRRQWELVAKRESMLAHQRTELAGAQDLLRKHESEIARLTEEINASEDHREAIRVRLEELTVTWRSHLSADQEIAEILRRAASDATAADGDGAAVVDNTAVVDEAVTHIVAHLEQLDELLRTALAEREAQDLREHQRRRVGAPTATDSRHLGVRRPP